MEQVAPRAELLAQLRSTTRDAGIKFVDTFAAAISDAHDEKLLLIYFHDTLSSKANNFVEILTNSNINSLFKGDFVIYISDAAELENEFFGLMDNEPDDVANLLYTFSVGKNGVDLVSKIDVLATPQEDILCDLHVMNSCFQDHRMKENDETVEECAKLYLDYFTNMDKDLYKYTSLKDALDIMNQPIPHLRKILMLYMYKDGSALTEQFNLCFNMPAFKKYSSLMIPVFWNISNVNYIKALKFACQRYFDQDLLEETVTSDEGGIFFFMPDCSIDSTPRIFTKITDTNTSIFELINSLEYMFTDFQQVNEVTDFKEIEVIDSYLHKTKNQFKNYVERCSLHDINEKCLQVPRKLLLLYFYTNTTKLEKTFPKVKHVFHKEQVVLLPWDISSPDYNEKLILSLQRTFGLKKIELILKAQQSGLFFFLPIGNCLVLHSVLEEGASTSKIEKTYREAHKFFMLETALQEDLANDSGPAAYQQVMCDQLGDRDFDCFQLGEKKQEGEQLREKIAFAYFGPPASETGYDEKQKKQIGTAYDQIKTEASKFGETSEMLYISFMRVCVTPLPDEKHKNLEKPDYEPALDFHALPLFGIRKCFECLDWKNNSACRKYIDHIGRIYESWEDFLENNKYPKVMLIAPKNGKYSCDYRGHVQLEVCMSPACGIGVAVLKGFDIGVAITGGVVGIAGLLTTVVALPVLPIVAMGTGISVGIYGIVRSGMTLAERKKYGESLSLASPEARGAYINIVAGSLGFTAAGAGFALAYAARSGVNIGLTTRAVMNGITVVNLTAGGAAITNSAYDVISQWVEDGTPNTLALVQLSSSILFFGHAVYNTQFAGTIVRDAQTTSINDILDSLSSNRQRKTVVRLLKSTSEQTGSTTSANAQVIKYMRNLDNVQEVVGVLTRDTRMMSRNGIKYTMDNGEIVFNGVKMNVNEFGNMSKAQRSDILSSLPADSGISKRPSTPVKTIESNNFTAKAAMNLVQVAVPMMKILFDPEMTCMKKINELLERFRPYIQRELFIVLGKFLGKIGFESNDLFRSLSSFYPNAQIPLRVMDIIVQYYYNEAYIHVPESMRGSVDFIVDTIEKIILVSMFSMAELVARLTAYFAKWVVQEYVKRQTDHAEQGVPSQRAIKHCDKCNGKFYQSQN